jgi:hypothetical protein
VVDIGVELFAVSCACARARHLAEHESKPEAVELADAFARMSRRKTRELFKGLWSNDDKDRYRFSKAVMQGRYAWLESGVMPS